VGHVSLDETRDMLLAGVDEDTARIIRARDEVVTAWCERNGKDRDALTFQDLLALRSTDEWKRAGQ